MPRPGGHRALSAPGPGLGRYVGVRRRTDEAERGGACHSVMSVLACADAAEATVGLRDPDRAGWTCREPPDQGGAERRAEVSTPSVCRRNRTPR